MTEKNAETKTMDEVVRRALADDLPADVAAGMRERIRSFREAKTGVETPGRGHAAWSWLSRRSVWAAVSILFLAAGILLQGGGFSSALADRISAIKVQCQVPE